MARDINLYLWVQCARTTLRIWLASQMADSLHKCVTQLHAPPHNQRHVIVWHKILLWKEF
jgi:hypothetical protein